MATIYLDPKIWGPHYWFFFTHYGNDLPTIPKRNNKKKIL